MRALIDVYTPTCRYAQCRTFIHTCTHPLMSTPSTVWLYCHALVHACIGLCIRTMIEYTPDFTLDSMKSSAIRSFLPTHIIMFRAQARPSAAMRLCGESYNHVVTYPHTFTLVYSYIRTRLHPDMYGSLGHNRTIHRFTLPGSSIPTQSERYMNLPVPNQAPTTCVHLFFHISVQVLKGFVYTQSRGCPSTSVRTHVIRCV